jgi:hypothetical protein
MVERLAAVRKSKFAAIVFAGALVLALGAISVSFYLRGAAFRDNCEALNGDRAILQGILVRFERSAPPAARIYFLRSINDLQPRDC